MGPTRPLGLRIIFLLHMATSQVKSGESSIQKLRDNNFTALSCSYFCQLHTEAKLIAYGGHTRPLGAFLASPSSILF
ncbi:hypothetical protein AB1N83_006051 [Pleurotus pulmonarius]